MIQKHIVDLRDFIFVLLKKHHDETYAEKNYRFLVMIWCSWFYMVPFMALAVIRYKLGIVVPAIMKDNVYLHLAVPLSLIIPYHWIFKYIFKQISIFPIDRNMEPDKYKSLFIKAIGIFLLGIALNILIPFGMDRLIPSFI